MPRADLLALTPDDLATLTNRGTVKRAQKELEAREVTCEIQDDPKGDLIVHWSDGIACRFPAGGSVHDAVCSSGVLGTTRHIVRSVLAYQVATPGNRVNEPDKSPAVQPENGASSDRSLKKPPARPTDSNVSSIQVWDPGAIDDDALVAHFRKPAISQARRRYESGVLVELTRGAKPVAHFLDDGCCVRFLVPGDLRYATADCAESMLSTWVPLAVWAFRELPATRLVGLISRQSAEMEIPEAALEKVDALLDELCRDGMSGLADPWSQRLARTEQLLREERLVWPAELMAELLHQCEMYRSRDARFEPRQVVQLLGELVVRMRAIRANSNAVPQLLIRGSKSDRPAEIAGGRLIGLGTGVRPSKRHTTISAYLQDPDSGSVVALERTFADPEPKSGEVPKSFTDLAATVLVRGVSLANVGSSQLLLKSGKRTPSGVLVLPRTAGSLTTHPQNFQWEQLKAPLALECFAQLRERLETLPPSCLRPRRCTENLHVVPVCAVDEIQFDEAHQRLTARLHDAQNGSARLAHAFHNRGLDGFNDLLGIFAGHVREIRYICGHVRIRNRSLEIQPVSLILENDRGRTMIQPWIANHWTGERTKSASDEVAKHVASNSEAPVQEFLQRLDDQLSDLLLTGLAQSHASAWSELAEAARQLGFVRLTTPIAGFADALDGRRSNLHWNDQPATRSAKELCLLSRLAAE